MDNPVFARDLKVGDCINGHFDGWLTIKEIYKHSITSSQNIQVLFTNGMSKKYDDSESVDAIRLY